MHRHAAMIAAAIVLVACSGAVEHAEPDPCSAPLTDAAPPSPDATTTDAGADAAPVNPCVEDDHSIAMCVRLGGPVGWTASAACNGVPIKHTQMRDIERPAGLACCEDLRGDDKSGAICCPETCQ